MDELKRLPESELDIMLVTWAEEQEGEGVTAPQILAGLDRPLTASALHSYLKRLEEKGFLSCEKAGKSNRYRSLVSRADYERQESQNILRKLYAGSMKRFAAALYDGGALSSGDAEELRAYLGGLKWED